MCTSGFAYLLTQSRFHENTVFRSTVQYLLLQNYLSKGLLLQFEWKSGLENTPCNDYASTCFMKPLHSCFYSVILSVCRIDYSTVT